MGDSLSPVPPYDDAPPSASALAESLRSFGYSLSTAIADLVDNSISAGAKHVWIDFHWKGDESAISLVDDGEGMTEAALKNAMRLGSKNPTETRRENDLGRFGLGMKTASFSQCRCVTVLTKQADCSTTTRRWDLDHLAASNRWQLLHNARSGAIELLSRLETMPSGTAILWQELDRVTKGLDEESEKHRDLFYRRCEEVYQHLGLVFHRLLEGRQKLKLIINGRGIQPTDPFFVVEATQILQPHHKSTPHGEVVVEPYVMPHESKLISAEDRALAGPSKGWLSQQGFYIYRNDRLLVSGSWLGFREWRKDDLHKLARIKISLTNALDEDWQIDVTKSKATPPDYLKDWLWGIGEATRARAKRVYTFRGERLVSNHGRDIHHVWDQIALHGVTSYRINRGHPMLATLLASSDTKDAMEAALRMIEEALPVPLIAFSAQEAAVLAPPATKEDELSPIRDALREAFRGLRQKGISPDECFSFLGMWEPFNRHPELIREIQLSSTTPA